MELTIFAASNMGKAVPLAKWTKTIMALLTFCVFVLKQDV
jgi:hypothetical protein